MSSINLYAGPAECGKCGAKVYDHICPSDVARLEAERDTLQEAWHAAESRLAAGRVLAGESVAAMSDAAFGLENDASIHAPERKRLCGVRLRQVAAKWREMFPEAKP